MERNMSPKKDAPSPVKASGNSQNRVGADAAARKNNGFEKEKTGIPAGKEMRSNGIKTGQEVIKNVFVAGINRIAPKEIDCDKCETTYRIQASAQEKKIWELMQRLKAAAQFAQEQNAQYGRLCVKLYPNLQQLLGNERAGVSSADLRKDLLWSMRHFVMNRSLEQEQMCSPDISAVPERKRIDAVYSNLKQYEAQGFVPECQFRLLVEKLLVCLPRSDADTLIRQMAACGIEALFYEDAPAEIQNTVYFAIYDDGIDVPVLLGHQADGNGYRVLYRGTHVVKKEDREKGECV